MTTVGVAVALLVVLSLTFVSLQACWTGTRSGQVQYVADAGALAADSVVAEYITAGETVDAVLLSLSLLGLTVYAVSAVCAFIPGAEVAAANLAEAGSKVLKARDSFAKTAEKGLKLVQTALPALCAVKANLCIQANSQASGISYGGLAVTLPADGVEIELADTSATDDAAEEIEDRREQIQEDAKKQKKAQDAMSEAWEEAWKADCGNTGACMRERASTLAGLSGASNPTVSSSENWSFSIALDRAKAYYQARKSQEEGSSYSGNEEEVGESIARKRFYAYALETVSGGSVRADSQGNEEPSLKSLARNVEQIRSTSLYTEAIYPVSKKGEVRTLHAYTGCSAYKKGEPGGMAAVSSIDAGTAEKCAVCKYSATTLGRVPSASTSIDNGFEYWYRSVVEAAEDYNAARKQAAETSERLEEATDSIKDALGEALKSFAGARYDPQPPGRYGCICIVYASGVSSQGTSSFLVGEAQFGTRVAISGATLAADPDANQAQVVEQAAAGLLPIEAVNSGLMKGVCSAWGSLLEAYSNGTDGLLSAFDQVLGKIPVVGTALSAHVADEFKETIADAGLEPADMKAYKPVLVNTSYILERDGSSLSQLLQSFKRAAESAGSLREGLFNELLACVGGVLSDYGVSDGVLKLATLSLSAFGIGLGERSVTIEAPDDLASQYATLLSSARSALAGG